MCVCTYLYSPLPQEGQNPPRDAVMQLGPGQAVPVLQEGETGALGREVLTLRARARCSDFENTQWRSKLAEVIKATPTLPAP